MLAELISYKTDVRKFRRMLVHQVQIFSELVKIPPPQVGAERVHEIQGVCEQRERTSSLASLHSEVTCDLVEGHISLASHRVNNIINVLTIFTAVFLPLGFLGGIYRMTLENMPVLKSRSGTFVLRGIVVSLTTNLGLTLRSRRWL